MQAGPYSRYRNLNLVETTDSTRGATRSLPVRRVPLSDPPANSRIVRYSTAVPADLMALKYAGREDLWWYLMDFNGRRLPETLEAGEQLIAPSFEAVTRVDRSRG